MNVNQAPAPAAASPLAAILNRTGRVLVGQPQVVEQLLITIVCRGHSEIEGPPGAGKWLAINSLAQCLGLTAHKLRCSPDLEPGDLIESMRTARAGQGVERPAGPLFSNLVLADGSEWLSPRAHNVLQQAMQERRVDWHGEQWELPDPFTLFAGRYPTDEPDAERGDDSLAELHTDRFLFRITLPYPAYHDEYEMARIRSEPSEELQPVISPAELGVLQQKTLQAAVAPPVIHYAVRLVRATRVHEGENPDFIYEWVQRGAGPRAVESLLVAAKARAVLDGRSAAEFHDLKHVVFPVLRHRIITNRNARSNGITTERVIERLLDEVPARIVGDDKPPAPGTGLTFPDWVPLDEELPQPKA